MTSVDTYLLARAASRLLNTGEVRPGQATAYLGLFLDENPTHAWLREQGRDRLKRFADGTERIASFERAKIKPHYEIVAGRDAWLKGICATYLAYLSVARGRG